MSTRTLINISLFVVGATLLTLFSKNAPQQAFKVPPPLTTLAPATVNVIRIKRHEQNDIVLQRSEDATRGWKMQTPFNLPADPVRVASLLNLLTTPSYERFSAPDNELTPFMLAAPQVSVIFDDTRIAFGARHPLQEDLRYVLVGEHVHIIADQLFHPSRTAATFFLNTKLVPAGSRLSAVQINDRIIRYDETGEAARIIQAWQELKATTIQRYYEVVEPLDTVILTQLSDEQIVLQVVSDRPNLILASPEHGIQYHISGEVADDLFPTPQD